MNTPILAGAPAGVALAVLFLALTIVATSVGLALWRKRDEARAVEKALQLEASGLRWQAAAMAAEIARRHKSGEGFDDAFFSLWRLSTPLVYPALGAALGRLDGDAIDRIGSFHAQLADARARLAEARAAGGFEPTPYRMLSCLVRAFYHIEPWFGTQRHRPLMFAREPEIGEASALLDGFERAGDEPVAVAYCWADCGVWMTEEDKEDAWGTGVGSPPKSPSP